LHQSSERHSADHLDYHAPTVCRSSLTARRTELLVPPAKVILLMAVRDHG
jgi:hypothetical protein